MLNRPFKTLFMAAALGLAACAASDTQTKHENQPHLPPPAFSVSETPAQTPYCGVRGGNTCETGEFCRRTIGDICGAADAPGICSPIPEMCTKQYEPVCGCDDRTYGNECDANSNGINAAYAGECKT